MGILSNENYRPEQAISGNRNASVRQTERAAAGSPEVVNKKITDVELPSLGSAANSVIDAAMLAGNEFTLSAPKRLSGFRGGIQNMMQGGSFREGEARARGEAEGALDAAEDNLGPIMSMGAQFLGALPRRSGPGFISEAVEGALGKPVATSGSLNRLGRTLGDLGRGGAVGAAEGAAVEFVNNVGTGQDYAETAVELGVEGGLVGFGTGVAAQALLGRLVPTALKYGLGLEPFKTRAKQKVGESILDTGTAGVTGEGITPDSIRREYPRMLEDNVGLMQTGAGEENAAEITNRLADTIMETTFPKTGTVKGEFKDYTDEYFATMGRINDTISETMTGIKNNFRKVLGEPRGSTEARGRNLAPQIRVYRDRYARIDDLGPTGLGNKTEGYRYVLDQVGNNAAMKLFNKADVTQFSSEQAQVFEEFQNVLRPLAQFSHTGGLHRAKHITSDPISGIDLDTAEINAKNLMDARQTLANQFKAGQLRNGTPVSKEHAAAAGAMLSEIDKVLAEMTGGESDIAREGFAKWMRVKDAEDTGAMFFDRRMSEDPEFGASMKEYMERYSDNGDVIEAFKTGYKSAMMKAIEDGAPLQVMYNMVGELPNKVKPETLLNMKTTGLENMRAVLGDDVTKELLETFSDDTELLKAQGKLRGYLDAKNTDEAAQSAALREMDELLIAAGVSPGQAGVLSTSTLGAFGRFLKQKGVKEAEVLMELAGTKGEDAIAAWENVLRTVETPTRVSAGRFGGAVTDNDEEETLMQEIEQYLASN